MDLRQRRKLETTEHIRETALALARDRGVAAVTIDAICEAAGISPRTFFNYFAFKEAVFVLPPPPFPPDIVERFVDGRGELIDDLIDMMAAQARILLSPHDMQKLRDEIAEAHPRLMPLQMAAFDQFQLELRQIIARRLDRPADDLHCDVLAAAVIGANRAAMERSVHLPDADLAQLVRQGLEALAEIIRAPGQIPIAAASGRNDQSGASAPSRG